MMFVGRVTDHASVKKLDGDRKVVNFSVAVNDRYRPKGSSEPVNAVTYFNCSYWINTTIAKFLTKGTLVELYGSVRLNTYTKRNGEPGYSLNFHTNTLNILQAAKNDVVAAGTTNDVTEPADDLPF
jgi:single-strand DNA-binding protein